MIVYSVEARGYALAIAFAFATCAVFASSAEQPSRAQLASLWLLPALGLLAHLTFLFFYGGYALWSLLRCMRGSASFARRLARWVRLHALPGAVLLVLYLLIVRDMQVAGGEPWTYPGVLALTFAHAFNAVPTAWVGVVLGGAVVALPLWDSHARWRAGRDSWPLPIAVVLIMPALITLVFQPKYLTPRYYLMPLAFLLLSLGRALAALAQRGLAARAGAVAAVALFAAGGLGQWWPFVRDGRGHYAAAVAAMAAETPVETVVVGSDHDVRNGLVLDYYRRNLSRHKTLVYVPHADRAQVGPDWIVLHSINPAPPPHPGFRLRSGDAYALRAHYPHSGPAGVDWYLYRKLAPQSAAAALR